ncbi:MAG: amino acid ABC transporter permease [Oscillospiraceae bacterium]|jgi:amine acid ABC transporter, permease protein, 3-TM region, His/Glu/Gln/Arg/opine family|nr:amino acid ABC transporter permease [Oscillospiraceae bacterium]MBQ4000531.1 amino acid ABC transporter permease [Oscillospiraceae bacterium]MBQ4240197.1 amino acid ABC transporter permease [Oscillospiraceae bacterium]MBQ5412623.1 amino acid ABC transporter permease [Oscillospiraceae bacterium]
MGPGIIEIFKLYYPIFLKGAVGTLKYAAIAVGFGSILGTIIGFIHLSKNKILSTAAQLYSTVIRGTPLLVQMYIGYYFLPMAVPALNFLSREQCVVLTMILNSSAYVSEIIRGGIGSVDIGQTEAARSLGMSAGHTMTRIVLPQALKAILPSLGNEYVSMIKETSLAGTFALYELTYTKTLLANKYLIWQPLFIMAIIYLVMTVVLSGLVRLLERRLSAGDRQ